MKEREERERERRRACVCLKKGPIEVTRKNEVARSSRPPAPVGIRWPAAACVFVGFGLSRGLGVGLRFKLDLGCVHPHRWRQIKTVRSVLSPRLGKLAKNRP